MIRYYEDKYLDWKDAVNKGIANVVNIIEVDAKKILQDIVSEDQQEKEKIEKIERSWFHRSATPSVHRFGFESASSTQVEFGDIVAKQLKEKGLIEEITTEAKPFFRPAIENMVGVYSARIIINSVEKAGLDEKI